MAEVIIRIGTRGSKLALIQAEMVKKLIQDAFPEKKTRLEIIKTKGDRILDSPLSAIGDKGLFTREIEDALREGRIDLAVHSLKDLPTELPRGLAIGGVLERAEVRDVLVAREGKKLKELCKGSVVGTSSLRRRAQLLAFNNSLIVKDIRGNVDTRIRKQESGGYDAVILAAAGVIRSGLDEKISEYLDPEIIMPAVCQGIIGIEIVENNPDIKTVLDRICSPGSMVSARAERRFLHTLEGGCQVPVACFSEIHAAGFQLTGLISSLNGQIVVKDKIHGRISDAENLAMELAYKIYNNGGKEILDTIRNNT